MNYTASDIKKLGTILGIYAHPDDEGWTAGGVLAAACANGQKVVCITATRGDAGETADESRWPQARLAEIREQELLTSLGHLGDIEHYWLNYRDGQLKNVPANEAIGRLTRSINRFNPDTIITFGPDGLTGHPDHKVVSGWVQAAAQASGKKPVVLLVRESAENYAAYGKTLHEVGNIYFAVEKEPVTIPRKSADIFFVLPPDAHEKKMASLQAHQSQREGIFANPKGAKAMYEYAKTECFVRAVL